MEHPLINDCTFSSANPSLSEIWPHFSSQNSNKRNNSLSNNNDSATKHIKLALPDDDQNAAFKPEPETISAQKQQQNVKPSSESPPPPPPPAKQDYIHVRARRGQATDSHSLAERVTTNSLLIFLILIYFQDRENI